MDINELKRKRELLATFKKRLHLRELQAAEYGISADPSIPIEIEKIKKQISQLEQELVTADQAEIEKLNLQPDSKIHSPLFNSAITHRLWIIIGGMVVLLVALGIWWGNRPASPAANAPQASSNAIPIINVTTEPSAVPSTMVSTIACNSPLPLTKLALNPTPYDSQYASVHSSPDSTTFSISLNTSGPTLESGVMWDFTTPSDLSDYNYIEVTLNLNEPILVVFVLTDGTDISNKPRLGAGVTSLLKTIKVEANGTDQVVALPLTQFHTDKTNVTRTYLKHINGLGIDVLERNWRGEHAFTVKNMRFCK